VALKAYDTEKTLETDKIGIMDREKRKTVAIIGQGYVGLPLAMAAVESGWEVLGIDIFEEKVNKINAGHSPVEDISNSQLKDAITSGRYKATTDFSLIEDAMVVTICVPTPLNVNREPDLSFLRNAITDISRHLTNETLVVSESTSYPGTLREVIIPLINSLKPKSTTIIYFASAPERVNPGDAVWHQKNTPRLVGGIDDLSLAKALSFYESICDLVVSVSTPEIAEAAKLLENTFRLVNIAFINEFTQLCYTAGINAQEVIDAASSKPYGFMPFRPGVGVGGHCIPVDPLYLTWWARQNGSKATFVEIADSINYNMPKFVAERTLSMIDSSVTSPKVLLLGIAYKPGLSDVRETPVSELRKILTSQGVEVAWHDPLVKNWEGTDPVNLDWDCHVAILATTQPGMSIDLLLGRGVQILDCTNSYPNVKGVFPL
jgi:UDP-N-acetyl-D-glucosamine dehydrogenase